MPRWTICQLDEVYVAGSLGGGRLVRGSRVNLDAQVSPGVTYADALGDLVRHFTPETAPTTAAVPVRTTRSTPSEKDA